MFRRALALSRAMLIDTLRAQYLQSVLLILYSACCLTVMFIRTAYRHAAFCYYRTRMHWRHGSLDESSGLPQAVRNAAAASMVASILATSAPALAEEVPIRFDAYLSIDLIHCKSTSFRGCAEDSSSLHA